MSKIPWTDKTWNPITGCTRVSAGCDKCYAVTMSHRLARMGQDKYKGLTVLNKRGERHFNGTVRCHEDVLDKPFHWRKPRMIFVNSMSDLFHKEVPVSFIDRVFETMWLCPKHTFQILTKRADRMKEYVDNIFLNRPSSDPDDPYEPLWPLPNVWLGVSVEDERVVHRIQTLRETPAAVRFVSYEPALGPVNWRQEISGVDWLIVGGESGPSARPFNLEWAWIAVNRSRDVNVPVFVKQLGDRPIGYKGRRLNFGPKGKNIDDWPVGLQVREMPEPIATETQR